MRIVENVEEKKRKFPFFFNFPFSISSLVLSMLRVENEACVIWNKICKCVIWNKTEIIFNLVL